VIVLAGVMLYPAPPEHERVQGHAYPIPSPDHRITVEVLNASGRAGLARGATRLLRRHGIDVVFFGNADANDDSTRIVVRQGDPGAGRDVRDALGMGRVTIQPDTLRRVDVSVILGRDFRIRGDLHP
jgi:LytR cell envelope-related transcriptional attenuator